jgi:tellurite resistance protein
MADEPLDFTREYLRAIRADNEKTHRMLFEIVERLGSLEQKVAFMATDIARIDGRLDGMNTRLDRIEKRLELADA